MTDYSGGNEEATGTPPLSRALAALRSIAEWQAALGRPGSAPFAAFALADAPAEFERLVRDIQTLTYGDLIDRGPTVSSDGSAQGVLGRIMTSLSERERAIMLERFLSDRPTTLHALGKRFGVSHQRVAQVEGDLRRKITDAVASDPLHVARVAAIARAAAPLTPLDQVLAMFPELNERLPGTAIPAWQLIDAIHDGFEIRQGWFAVPTLSDAVAACRFVIEEGAVWPGVTPLGANREVWGFSHENVESWAELCGYVSIQDYLVEPAANAVPALAQAMVISSTGQTAESLRQLLQLFGERRSRTTVAAALRDDPRFARDAEGRWTFATPRPSYADALDAVGRLVEGGNSVPVADAVAAGEALGASADAMAVYCRYGRFETVAGKVRRRERALPMAFPPADAPRFFRIDGGWACLVTLTPRNVESGRIQVGSAVGVLLGLVPPATVQLPSLPGASVEWGLPYCYVTLPPDALRRFRVGDRLFLWFAFGSFEVRPATAPRGGLTGLAAALDSFGLDSSGDDDADLRALASALDLPPGSGLDRVITACWRKREWDALAALEALEVLGASEGASG